MDKSQQILKITRDRLGNTPTYNPVEFLETCAVVRDELESPKKDKWNPYLTASEILEMQAAGYMVRSHWIMPGGYYEHYLIRLGGLSGRDEIKTTMSPRACYTYFKRHLTKHAPDAGKSAASQAFSTPETLF